MHFFRTTARFASQAILVAICTYATTAALAAAGVPDGATITNSGSTNSAGYVIKIWSDGRGSITIGSGNATSFTVTHDVAQRFFADAKAARANPGAPGHCMKSASFGTTTSVKWHGWTSVDLQCPPLDPAVSALARDAQAIEAAAGIGTTVHLIPRPHEPRRLPSETTTSPTSTPTP